MSAVRLRRLQADYDKLNDYVNRHPRLRMVDASGDPPERYQIELRIRSVRQVDDNLKVIKEHLVEITLPRSYPRTPPQCRMLSPIFHPNIAPHAICVGDHWSAGEPLWSIVARIGEMISYQSYNTKSPLNGEAARWVDENLDRLPLDEVSMLVEEPSEVAAGGPADRPPAAPAPRRAVLSPVAESRPAEQPIVLAPADENSNLIHFTCPECGTGYRVPADTTASRARCKQCRTVIPIPR